MIFIFLFAVLTAQGQSRESKADPIVTVCELLYHPLEYDGKLVRVKGSLDANEEGTWLTSAECPGAMVTEDHVWPSWIALTEATFPLRLHSVDFNFDAEGARRINEKAAKLRKTVSYECMLWTFTGLFETRRDWSKFRDSRYKGSDGKTRYIGFGHLSQAPAELLVKSKDDVTIIRGCGNQNQIKQR